MVFYIMVFAVGAIITVLGLFKWINYAMTAYNHTLKEEHKKTRLFIICLIVIGSDTILFCLSRI